ncbi:helix-turn-helix domain-containing protein [Nocardia asteroides]|uniref:helix-turn-helix domain-containing protein n=1 Tax=Nocardia asteroides TaxID=1824 RepID=UPI0037C594C1
MREWIVKLSATDGGAAAALRVIEHFDTLVDQRSSALAMVRAAAALADCPVGLADPERGVRVGVDATGRSLPDLDVVRSGRQVAQFEGTTVWLDRDGPPSPLDHLILERFARSLHAVKKSRDTTPAVTATRIACDPGVAPATRENTVRRLGLGSTVTVVATHVADAQSMPPGLVVDDYQIHLFPAPMAAGTVPAGIAAGTVTCAATEICRQWHNACTALRIAVDIATGDPTHVRYEQLGSIATIVETVDADTAARAPDVQRVGELQAQRPWVVSTLETVLAHSSIREAARQQNLHHSTMRQRIDWLERQLGYPLLSHGGYARVSTTLTLWRITMAVARSTVPVRRTTDVCRSFVH